MEHLVNIGALAYGDRVRIPIEAVEPREGNVDREVLVAARASRAPDIDNLEVMMAGKIKEAKTDVPLDTLLSEKPCESKDIKNPKRNKKRPNELDDSRKLLQVSVQSRVSQPDALQTNQTSPLPPRDPSQRQRTQTKIYTPKFKQINPTFKLSPSLQNSSTSLSHPPDTLLQNGFRRFLHRVWSCQ
jgi:hypothetical protein